LDTHSRENSWSRSPGPLFMLAPMEDVTDTAFRELVLRLSRPGMLHVLFTEFVSTDGICHERGRASAVQRLVTSEGERQLLQQKNVKLVAQIWGARPEKYRRALQYMADHFSFDGIDINMGCPVRKIVAQGGCSALIDNEPLAGQIIHAVRESTDLPVSVKTRLGVARVETERWMTFLLQQPVDAIILHGRTQKQQSDGQADWNEIEKAARLKDQIAPHVRIIGNGDVGSLAEARDKAGRHGLDGVMIGRGIFQNPWLFDPEKETPGAVERLETLLAHLELFESNWGDRKHFLILRRFFKIYLSGFPGSAELRNRIMQVTGFDEARTIVAEAMNILGDQGLARPG
jgi:nifR3 family TIM-barrel protein